jgi:TRAP-type C4-dicarboxylate transport system permease small subunit
MRRLLDRTYELTGYLAGVCMIMIFLIISAQVVGRETGFLIPGADDLASWFCAATAFFAMAHTFKRGELVQVGLLLDRLGPRARRAAEGAALLVAAVFSAYMSQATVRYVIESFKTHEMPQGGTLAIPLWIPQSSFALGAILLFVAVADDLILLLRGHTPGYRAAEQARLASGDFSETL